MKKILNIISGIGLYYICVFLLMGYGHTETHVPLNTSIGLRFLEMVSTNAMSDKTKFQNYEFNWNNDKQPTLTGLACSGDGYTSVDMPADVEKSYSPIEWISQGGWMEDEPWGPASICHFYDPKGIDNGKKYLSDNSGNVEWLVSIPKEWFSRDAKSWATGTENAFGWPKAKEYVIKALKESDVTSKNRYMAKAYRCLGQTLHLVADMGCPPHVRNDSHPPKISFLVGDPDPYENICKTLDTYTLSKANSPNPALTTQLTATQKFADIFEALAKFTNEKFYSGGTIYTDRYKPAVRPTNPYPSPLLTEADYNPSEYAYYRTYDGVKVKMCKDKVAVSFANLLGKDSIRGRPYLDYECVESMASAIIPNVVEAGANAVRMFVPSLKIEITEARIDSGGIIRGRVSYTVPSLEDEYSGLFDLNDIYNGPVVLYLNGTDTGIQAIARKNNFEFRLNGSLKDLKKDDLAMTKLEFGGIVLKSIPQKVKGIQYAPVIDLAGSHFITKYFDGYYPWGCGAVSADKISIFGKGWSTDPAKTMVKIDGIAVPITNLVSGGTMVNETEIQVEVPKNKQGNVSISVESEGSVSAAKNYFVGIPLDVLNKMPVLGFRNTFITKYSDHLDGNKEQNFSCGFELLKAYNQIESAVWSGNILTVKGKITYTGGLVEEHLLILTFSEDGSKVSTVDCEIKALIDIKFTLKDLAVEVITSGMQLSYNRKTIPANSYSMVSGYVKRTSPPVSYRILGMAEGYATWPNEFMLWFEFSN
jgi:hypothetical protein